ncbi:MAG: ferritin-like domain-containing protein [Bacteroidota bacterium]|nr:ferritin-like domain-containing protein [Bacteroidota bacterium]
MDNMNHLRDLLVHDVHDLYSAEEQIIKAMPAMIASASNPQLKQSLEQHLRVTEQQRDRLKQVRQLLGADNDESNTGTGIFAGLFGTGIKCKGMEGIISEGQEVMAIDMDPAVKDAAIICAAQKVEHYEICGYGTAKAYAEELGLIDVAQLLQQTLMEEYEADDRLTSLAIGSVNRKAERGGAMGTTATTMGTNMSGSNL